MRMAYNLGSLRSGHQVAIDEWLAARKAERLRARARDARPARRLTLDAAPDRVRHDQAKPGEQPAAERTDEIVLLPPGAYELREAGDRVEIYGGGGEFVMALPAGEYDGIDRDDGVHVVKRTAVGEPPASSPMPFSSGELDHVAALRRFNERRLKPRPAADTASAPSRTPAPAERALLVPFVGVGNVRGPRSLAAFNSAAKRFWRV